MRTGLSSAWVPGSCMWLELTPFPFPCLPGELPRSQGWSDLVRTFQSKVLVTETSPRADLASELRSQCG